MLPGCERRRQDILSPQISAQTPKARLVEVVYCLLLIFFIFGNILTRISEILSGLFYGAFQE